MESFRLNSRVPSYTIHLLSSFVITNSSFKAPSYTNLKPSSIPNISKTSKIIHHSAQHETGNSSKHSNNVQTARTHSILLKNPNIPKKKPTSSSFTGANKFSQPKQAIKSSNYKISRARKKVSPFRSWANSALSKESGAEKAARAAGEAPRHKQAPRTGV